MKTEDVFSVETPDTCTQMTVFQQDNLYTLIKGVVSVEAPLIVKIKLVKVFALFNG